MRVRPRLRSFFKFLATSALVHALRQHENCLGVPLKSFDITREIFFTSFQPLNRFFIRQHPAAVYAIRRYTYFGHRVIIFIPNSYYHYCIILLFRDIPDARRTQAIGLLI